MATEMPLRVALALTNLADTLDQISRLVALGREAVERDAFLPLAAEQLGIRLGHDVETLPEAWREDRPQVPWQSIRGLRNRLAHDYHEIDFDILWDVYAVAAPAMQAALAADFEAAQALVADAADREGDQRRGA